MELGPAGAQESDGAAVDRPVGLLGRQRALRSCVFAEGPLHRWVSPTPATSTTRACGDQLGGRRLTKAIAVLLDGNSTGAANERRIELVDVSGVGESPGQVRPHRAVLGWG
jgi:phage terminase large subunit-like protein